MQVPLGLLGESFISLNQFDKTLKSSGLTIGSVVTSNKGEQDLAIELNQKLDFSDVMGKACQLRSDFENGIIQGRPDEEEGDLFFKAGPKFKEIATQTPMSKASRRKRASSR